MKRLQGSKIVNQANWYNTVNNTIPKKGETRILTYTADTYIPAVGRELGLKLTMVDGARYRVNSKTGHGKGYKVDVSMSEHNQNNRERILERMLNYEGTKKIGTSDVMLLRKFAGNPKLVDFRDWDRTHGTNHINHIDIELNTKFGGIAQGK